MRGPEGSSKPGRIKHKLRHHRRLFFGTPPARDRRSAPYFLCPVSQNYSALFTPLHPFHPPPRVTLEYTLPIQSCIPHRAFDMGMVEFIEKRAPTELSHFEPTMGQLGLCETRVR